MGFYYCFGSNDIDRIGNSGISFGKIGINESCEKSKNRVEPGLVGLKKDFEEMRMSQAGGINVRQRRIIIVDNIKNKI